MELLVGLLITAAVVGLTMFVVLSIESHNCAFASKQYQRRTHFDNLAGCYIQLNNGQLVKLDQYRVAVSDR